MNGFLDSRLNVKRKILIVGEEGGELKDLVNIVGSKYDILYSPNGKEALNLIMDGKESIALILLDYVMPAKEESELISIVTTDLSLAHIPVIVLTSDKGAEVKSISLGAADYISKPFDHPEVIIARIDRTIEYFESNNIIRATQNDSLTGLFNRDFFMEYALVHDQYYPDVNMDAIVLDVNRFHLLNEMHGRAFGDEVLLRIADKIRDVIAENRGIACRNNADVFFIYMPHSDFPEETYKMIEDGVEELLRDARARIRMGVYPNVNRSLEMNRRFDCALLACNSIRSNYSVQIAFYDEEMHERETYDEKLISDMEKALSEKQFKVFYQPIYDVSGDEPLLTSAEALIRWEHPELGMISPDKFIPLFEENGLIQKLDEFVWKEAALQIKKWRKDYGNDITVSVNVSRIDICQNDFVKEIKAVVYDNGLTPDDYFLEVTESAYTDNSDQIIDVVTELRNEGFKIEMDDFGTGYSSLNMLSSLPIDVLKLDMKFVQNIHKNPKDLKMVEIIMDIAKFLNVTVIAEGVEVKEQYDLLKKTGCNIIQGFYFSKPVRPEKFEEFLRSMKASEDKGE